MSISKHPRGLLAHSAKAGEARRDFLALRLARTKPVSDAAQLKYFLLHSRAGMTGVFTFALVLFYAGIGG